MNEGVRLFSPLFEGNKEAWEWLCHASNGRNREPPELTDAQRAYAERVGYLPYRRRA